MKLRTGFVSNSSSSSFLVLYNSNIELDRFRTFKGSKKMWNDLKICSDEKILSFLTECLEDSRILLENDMYDRKKGFWSDNFRYSPAVDLYHDEFLSYDDYEFLYNINRECDEADFVRVANNIFHKLKEKYSISCFVEYTNDCKDSEFGYYMDVRFMKFLASDPEKKVYVIRKSNRWKG